jgi:hypothetical protein
VDGVLKFLEGAEDAALEAPLGQEREQALDRVEPGCRGRSEVEESLFLFFHPALKRAKSLSGTGRKPDSKSGRFGLSPPQEPLRVGHAGEIGRG